jgi:SAM-dependent methyltransferase
MLPQLGRAQDFEAVHRLFHNSGYTYENLCRRLGVDHAYQFRTPGAEILLTQPVEDAFGALSRLFSHGLYLERSRLAQLLPQDGIAALERLNLLASESERQDTVFATVLIFPYSGILTAYDRHCTPRGESITPPADAVYPAMFENTLSFVARLPQSSCNAMLDIGTGTGIAALVSAGAARHVWATDITARSACFAELNRRLNGIENITVLEGDMYEPVTGLTFDRIVTHPPYVPGKISKFIFREGGEDGEQIFRRAIEGLPQHLRPGGRFYSMLMASDREGETFEQRIRKWLAGRADEFDILVAYEMLKPAGEYLDRILGIRDAEKEYWRDLWARNGTTAVIYGSVVIERHASARPPAAARVQTGGGLDAKALDTLMDWETAGSAEASMHMVLSCRPVLSPKCEMTVTHRVRDGKFVPEEFVLEVRGSFPTRGKTPPWMARAVAGCDGSLTWRQRFDALIAEGAIPSYAKPEEFARMLKTLIASGVLTI